MSVFELQPSPRGLLFYRLYPVMTFICLLSDAAMFALAADAMARAPVKTLTDRPTNGHPLSELHGRHVQSRPPARRVAPTS